MEYTLKAPTRSIRITWLLAGLAVGYLAHLAGIPTVHLLLLLAVLAGASGNWSF